MAKFYGIGGKRIGKIGNEKYYLDGNNNLVQGTIKYKPINSAWIKKEEFKEYLMALFNGLIPQIYVLNELPEELYQYALLFVKNGDLNDIYVDKDGVRTKIEIEGGEGGGGGFYSEVLWAGNINSTTATTITTTKPYGEYDVLELFCAAYSNYYTSSIPVNLLIQGGSANATLKDDNNIAFTGVLYVSNGNLQVRVNNTNCFIKEIRGYKIGEAPLAQEVVLWEGHFGTNGGTITLNDIIDNYTRIKFYGKRSNYCCFVEAYSRYIAPNHKPTIDFKWDSGQTNNYMYFEIKQDRKSFLVYLEGTYTEVYLIVGAR